MKTAENVLEIKNLTTIFDTENGPLSAVDDVSLTLPAGKTLGLVGESGCGKSVTSLSVLRLIPDPPGRVSKGEVWYTSDAGRVDLLKLSSREIRRIRGNEISMIFQEPMTSLNPVFTVGNQIIEAIRIHRNVSKQNAYETALQMLEKVRISDPSERMRDYPHQLSGGMRQRVMIAMALVCEPKILIADEPTTALDVTIQAQILELLRELRNQMGMSMILITHDLGVVAQMADEIAVMYAGKIVEQGPVREVFKHPRHPYTLGLLRSLPRAGVLEAIPGMVPNLLELPPGCRFQARCKWFAEDCRVEPELRSVVDESNGDRKVRCVRDL